MIAVLTLLIKTSSSRRFPWTWAPSQRQLSRPLSSISTSMTLSSHWFPSILSPSNSFCSTLDQRLSFLEPPSTCNSLSNTALELSISESSQLTTWRESSNHSSISSLIAPKTKIPSISTQHPYLTWPSQAPLTSTSILSIPLISQPWSEQSGPLLTCPGTELARTTTRSGSGAPEFEQNSLEISHPILTFKKNHQSFFDYHF